MNKQAGPQDPLVFSYLELRKAVGMIGFALPFVLAVGKALLQGPGIQASISDYYYTDMRNVFVGSLCAIGVFLMAAMGYDWKDKVAGYLAGVFAIGVALFPTNPDLGEKSPHPLIGALHWLFASLLFLTFSYFCLALFIKTTPGKESEMTPQKRRRNKVYRVCGSIILACILLIVVVVIPKVKTLVAWLRPVFWLEAAAVLTFGVAWLTKGEAILKDEEPRPS